MDVHWLLLILLDIFILFSGLVTAEPKDNQVYITSRLCGATVNVDSSHDQDGWKRFLFAHNEMCSGAFSCQVTFTANQAEICLDFSRLRLNGSETEMVFYQKNKLVERLTNERYPRKERYMHLKTCVSSGKDLSLEIRADCSRPLNMAFMGWFYVYSQSSTTGVMYFVDGVCKHRHRLSEGVPVTVRSQFWVDTAREESVQDCSLRLSMPYSYERRRICITWQPLEDPIVPAGIKITIRKVYVNMDRTLNHYVTFVTGNKVYTGHQCFVVSKIHEIAIEVHRNTTSAGFQAVQDGKTVFSLRAELEEKKKPTTVRQEKPIVDVEAEDTELDEGDSPFSDLFVFLKVALGVAIVIACCCCVRFCVFRSKGSTSESMAAEDRDTSELQQQGTVNSNIGTRMTHPEERPTHPLINPTAPSFELEQDHNRGTLAGAGVSDLPPSYDEIREDRAAGSVPGQAPPSYHELFPQQKH